MLSLKSPSDVAEELAKRVKQKRLDNNWSREELSRRSGVTVASIRRFETTSEISLVRFLKLCVVLRALDDFENVLLPGEPRSIADIEKNLKKIKRKRASRKSS